MMGPSNKKVAAVLLALAAAWWIGSVSAAPASPKLVLTGTVTEIVRVARAWPSRRNWGVTLRVERVKEGEFPQSEFSFTVQSPERAGLIVGRRYTIEAEWIGRGYVVDEVAGIRAENVAR